MQSESNSFTFQPAASKQPAASQQPTSQQPASSQPASSLCLCLTPHTSQLHLAWGSGSLGVFSWFWGLVPALPACNLKSCLRCPVKVSVGIQFLHVTYIPTCYIPIPTCYIPTYTCLPTYLPYTSHLTPSPRRMVGEWFLRSLFTVLGTCWVASGFQFLNPVPVAGEKKFYTLFLYTMRMAFYGFCMVF